MTKPENLITKDEFKYEFKWFKDDFDTDPRTRGRSFKHRSPMEESRSRWEPPIPQVFDLVPAASIEFDELHKEPLPIDPSLIKKWPELNVTNIPVLLKRGNGMSPLTATPPKVGIILAGEWVPSSGTHNIIVGIVRYICDHHKGEVFGFLGGPQGFARNHYVNLDSGMVSKYLNQGGADLLGFGSLRAITESDYAEILNLSNEVDGLSSLVIIGGPNELAHVAQIVQHSRASSTSMATVIGVFQSPNSNVYLPSWLPVTLGYDSARCALAELVGNIALDGLSSGRPSEVNIIRCGSTTVTMETALLVGPAMTIIADEIKARNISLKSLLGDIENLISSKTCAKTTTILMSDKFYHCIPGFLELQAECRSLYVLEPSLSCNLTEFFSRLTPQSAELLANFSEADQGRIARAYDADGNPTWPSVEPEKFLALLLAKNHANLVVRTHYVGQEARCPLPTNFDCSLGLSLGYTAAALSLRRECHGFVAAVRNLIAESPKDWECGGFPLEGLLSVRPTTDSSSVLTHQFGGAHQELINLAKQRTEREACVPLISLRPSNILTDCLFFHFEKYRQQFGSEFFGATRQPGPHQFDHPVPNLALLAAYGQGLDSKQLTSRLSSLEKIRLESIPRSPKGPWILRDAPVTMHRSPLTVLQLAFPRTYSVPAVELVAEEGISDHNYLSCPGGSIGILFLGRPAAGCHNILFGLCQAGEKVIGFTNGATGLITCEYIELTSETCKEHINLSGLDLLGRTETPIRTNSELAACVNTCNRLGLKGLVVVGGLGTHADTALLAERLPTYVIGIPASIENDIPFVEKSIGHDTAVGVYSSIVGSLATLAASSKRQWCFVRIAGRSLSHVIAQVALRTHPNLVLLSEELEGWSLADLINLIADLISERAKKGSDFGIVIFAESVLDSVDRAGITGDPERVLESLVGRELQRRRMFENGESKTSIFRSSVHAVSHQARSALPTQEDCDLGYTAGLMAARLIAADRTGLLVCPSLKELRAVPLVSLLTVSVDKQSMECFFEIEQRKVDFEKIFSTLPPPSERRFMSPGPIQWSSESNYERVEQAIEQSTNVTKSLAMLNHVSQLCSQIMSLGASASDESARHVVTTGLVHTLSLLRGSTRNAINDKQKGDGRKKCTRTDLLRPCSSSHCRVIKLVPE